MSNGKRSPESVVFRVDVEDRGEPGGTNGPPPPDRYRMRIWFVDADSSEGLTLRQTVACADPTTENITAPTPDIDDGGDLIRGNQQIHPPLNKTCTSSRTTTTTTTRPPTTTTSSSTTTTTSTAR